MARALVGDFRHLLDGVTLTRARGESIEREDDDTGSGLTMPYGHLAESPIVRDHDTFSRLCQRENAFIAVASADVLGIHDVEAALDQSLDDCSRNAFVREEARHACGSLCSDDPSWAR